MKKGILLLFWTLLLLWVIPISMDASAETTVSAVSLSGAVAPEAGKAPDVTVTPAAAAHATVQQVVWWSPSGQLGETELFDSGINYTMVVYLMPKSGYAFAKPEAMGASLSGVSDYTSAVESYGGDEQKGRALYFYFPTAEGFGVPQITSIANTDTGVKLTWAKVTGASKYVVWRKAPGETEFSQLAVTTSLTYTNKNAAAGKSYQYAVKAIATDGRESDLSQTESIVHLRSPKSLSAQGLTNAIRLDWEKSTGAAKYAVYRKGPGETGFKKIGTTAALSYTDKTAVSGTEYRYSVRAAASDGSMSAYTAGQTAKYMKTPTLSSVSCAAAGVKVTWGSVAGAAKYSVYRRGPGETVFKKIGTTAALSYTDKTAVSGKEYRYTIRAVHADGTLSAYSAGMSVKYMKAPPITSAVNLNAGIKITWESAAAAVKYNVYRKGPEDTAFKKIASLTTELEYTDPNVTAGKEYRYSIRSISADGTMSAYSAGKTVVCLKPPSIIGASSTATGLKVSFSQAAGAAKYRILRKAPGETAWTAVATVAETYYLDQAVTSGKKYTYSIRAVASDTTTMSPLSPAKTYTYTKP